VSAIDDAARKAYADLTPETLQKLGDCRGIGRNVLEGRIAELIGFVSRLQNDRRQLNNNLMSVQTRCTELLQEVRDLRRECKLEGIVLPGWTCPNCGGFNGEAKERLIVCRCCPTPRPD
jgi:hypothetical protein